MSKKKQGLKTRNHIVPKRYLQNFGVTKDGNYCVQTYLRKDKKFEMLQKLSDVNSVGFVKKIYLLKSPIMIKHELKEQDCWETFFADNIEAFYGENLSLIITKIKSKPDNTYVLTPDEKIEIAKRMVFQLLRTPIIVKNHIYTGQQTAAEFAELVRAEFENFEISKHLSKREFDELMDKYALFENNYDFVKYHILEHISKDETLTKYAQFLLNKTWVVFYNPQGSFYRKMHVPFFTSDNPVLVYDSNMKLVHILKVGLGKPFLRFFYPLTPEILIGVLPKNVVDRSADSKKWDIGYGEYFIDLVEMVNLGQVQNCINQFYVTPQYTYLVDKKNTI